MSIWERLSRIDRRIIYLIIFLVVFLPLLFGIRMKVSISPAVQSAYNAINALPEGSVVMVSIDYDPASMPELQPMLKAILRHCFGKNLKVVLLGFWPLGLPLGTEGLNQVATEYHKVYGIDYVNLGYRPGDVAVMVGMGKNIKSFFMSDYRGKSCDSLPLMQHIRNYDDIAMVVGLEAGSFGDMWVQYVGARFHQRIILGVTAVMAAMEYPYLQANQIGGLIGGLKGAAEYELLIKHPGFASTGMAAQSWAHIAIILFIIIGNIGYFMERRRRK